MILRMEPATSNRRLGRTGLIRPRPFPNLPRRFRSVRKLSTLSVKLGPEFFLGRQHKFVPAREDLFVLVQNGGAHDRGVFLSAKDDPYGRVVVGRPLYIIDHPDVHIHLPDVLMSQLT